MKGEDRTDRFAGASGLLTYADLAGRWGVGLKQARRLVRRLNIPILGLGHRTVRFRPADVTRAEARQAGAEDSRPARFVIR